MNCILKTLITTLFITSCWVYPLFAQFGFPREGVKAGIANQLNYTHNSTAALTNGGLAHTWFEGDTAGVFRIYTRFVSPEGRLLPPNGAVILSTGRNHAMDPKVAATSDGDAVIVWRENTGGDNWNVRAQRLNANGEILWEEGGHIYHRVDNLRNFSGYFIPDYEGGGYLIISGTSMRNPSWAYSLDENGELRNGWPEEGLHRDSTSIFVIPSRGGGGWINFEDEQWNRFNPEGSLRWDEGFIPQPPEWEYAAGYGNFLSDGWNLFCFYQGYREDGEGVAFAVSVYDTAGEQAASEVIYHRQANNLCDASSDCFVAEDGRCYLLVNEYYLGGDFITPIEMPLIYCYNPFGDEPFPFGEDGIRLPPFEEGELMWGASLFRVGEMLVIADNGGDYIAPPCRVWTLNSDGEPVWEEQPRVFDQAAVLRHHGGQNTFFNGRQFWVQSGLGCFSYNAEGEVLTGEQPVWLFPEFRSYLGYIGGGMTDESDFQFLYYPEAGLFKQTIGMDGELEYPLHGEQIREAWPRIWNPNNEYGEISGHPWLWAETNSSSGKIIFFDEELNIELERDIQFTGGFPNLRGKTVYEGNHQLLLICNNNNGSWTLVKVGINGEVTAPVRWTSGRIRLAQFWEGYGWLLILDNENTTQVALLNDDFREVWQPRASYPGFGSSVWRVFGVIEEADQIQLARLKYDRETDLYWVFQSTITEEGRASFEDSVRLFNETINTGMDEWFCYPRADGRFWFHSRDHIGWSWVQGIDSEGRKLIPNDGLRLRRNSCFIPTTDGGAWALWDDLDSLRVLRLDDHGRPWRHAYPPEGIGLYDRDEYGLFGATLDLRTNRLWAAYGRSWKVLNEAMPPELRIQVFGDEWTAVGEEACFRPSTPLIISSYPNPFNSTITISYNIPFPSPVSVKVFDLTGRETATLVEGWKNAGEYKILWGAGTAPSGYYTLKLQTANQTHYKPLIHIR